MPYKVKMGSLVVVAKSVSDALKIVDASSFPKSQITVTDLDGNPVDLEKLGANLKTDDARTD